MGIGTTSSLRVAPGFRIFARYACSSGTRDPRVPGECSERACARGARAKSRRARSEPLAVVVFTMSNSAVLFVPAARCCARVGLYSFASIPKEGWAERRQAQLSCCRVCETRLIRTRRGAARPMTRDARLSALHRGDFRPGPRFHLRHCLRIRTASSSQPGRNAWRAVSRTSRARGYEPRPQDATPRSAFRTVSRRRPQ